MWVLWSVQRQRSAENEIAPMQPAQGLAHGMQPVVRSRSASHFVDVDGSHANTIYNDRFLNPKKFFVSNLDGAELVQHVQESLSLLRQLI
jgi:hypothetical protein